MTRLAGCAAAVALAVVFAAACTNDGPKGFATLELDGTARLTSAGHEVTVSDSRALKRGDTIKITGGTATLKLSRERRIELRRSSVVKLDTVPVLESGDALLVAGDTRLTVRAAGSTVSVDGGVGRLARGLGVEAATYRGSMTMSSTGRRLAVPALRQATIPSLGVLPAKAEPLRLRSTDAWDRRYLGDAIELTEQLQSRSDGLTGQLPPGEGRTSVFLASLLPELTEEPAFGPALINRSRLPGETLVGASIAAAGRTGGFAERWQAVFGFRDEGAAWGLVALDQRVDDVPKLSSKLDAALGRAQSFTIQVAAAEAPAESTTAPPSTSPPTTTQSPSPGGGGGAGPSPPEEPPPPAPGPLDPVADAVDDLVSGLLDALGLNGPPGI